MSTSILLIFFATACSAGGQLALKAGMSQVGRIGAGAFAQPFELVTRVAASPLVIGGLGLYAISMVSWLAVLSRVPLSFAYPLVAIGYLITAILAWLLLGESIPGIRWLGIATICLGVFLISRS